MNSSENPNIPNATSTHGGDKGKGMKPAEAGALIKTLTTK